MPEQLILNIQEQINKGIDILKSGGVVAFPTDTVYGLGACADNPSAIARIYEVKERPKSMALPMLLASTCQIGRVATQVPEVAWLLASRFLPGALTLVLLKADSILDIITAGGRTIAIRVPAHPVPVSLIEGLGPIVGTSANITGKPSPLTAEEVHAQLGDRIDLVINGGRCPGGLESTIVDVTGKRPIVLREGAISRQELKRVCEDIL